MTCGTKGGATYIVVDCNEQQATIAHFATTVAHAVEDFLTRRINQGQFILRRDGYMATSYFLRIFMASLTVSTAVKPHEPTYLCNTIFLFTHKIRHNVANHFTTNSCSI